MTKVIEKENIKFCSICGTLVLTKARDAKSCPKCNFKSLNKAEVVTPPKKDFNAKKEN